MPIVHIDAIEVEHNSQFIDETQSYSLNAKYLQYLINVIGNSLFIVYFL
jgi:hypothetical protein